MKTEPKLTVSFPPHIHGGDSISRNMYGVLLALLPALFASFWAYGLGAVVVTLTSVAACLLFEGLLVKYVLKRPRTTLWDGSALITGILLAMNLPSNLPVWIILLGALFAIGVAKMSFGGLGCNIVNPALAGRVFLLISFPVQMTSWPLPGQWMNYTDAVTGATPLELMKQAVYTGDLQGVMSQLPRLHDILLGTTGGSIGEISAAAILAGLLFMLWRKIITWHIPVSIFLSIAVFAEIFHLISPSSYAPALVHLLAGGVLLGAVFMATDYTTSPMTVKGMWIYGILIGLITILIRNFGSYPEGISFAILIMNVFTPLINTYCKPRRFGRGEVTA